MLDAPHSLSIALLTGALAAAGAGCAADASESSDTAAQASNVAAQTSDIATQAAALEAAPAGRCPRVRMVDPGVISTPASEGRMTFSPDGETAYFHRYIEAESRFVILESHHDRRRGAWSEPVMLPFCNTAFTDFDPFVTLDGKYMYFASDRPTDGSHTARPDWEIWRSTRTRSGWSAPVHLGPEINTPDNELYPTTTADGTLYFNSDRPGGFGAWDIYTARRKGTGFELPENAGPGINTENWEFNPMPSPDGRFIFFGSLGRKDSFGGADIYTSFKLDGAWQPAKNVGACINTSEEEFHPSIDWARGSLFFARSRTPPEQADLYEVTFGGSSQTMWTSGSAPE